ncbi:unnamed protein product [Caenorhabditis nigoni]
MPRGSCRWFQALDVGMLKSQADPSRRRQRILEASRSRGSQKRTEAEDGAKLSLDSSIWTLRCWRAKQFQKTSGGTGGAKQTQKEPRRILEPCRRRHQGLVATQKVPKRRRKRKVSEIGEKEKKKEEEVLAAATERGRLEKPRASRQQEGICQAGEDKEKEKDSAERCREPREATFHVEFDEERTRSKGKGSPSRNFNDSDRVAPEDKKNKERGIEKKKKARRMKRRCWGPREATERSPGFRSSRSCQDEGEEEEGPRKVLAAATERGRLEVPRASRQHEDVECGRHEERTRSKR